MNISFFFPVRRARGTPAASPSLSSRATSFRSRPAGDRHLRGPRARHPFLTDDYLASQPPDTLADHVRVDVSRSSSGSTDAASRITRRAQARRSTCRPARRSSPASAASSWRTGRSGLRRAAVLVSDLIPRAGSPAAARDIDALHPQPTRTASTMSWCRVFANGVAWKPWTRCSRIGMCSLSCSIAQGLRHDFAPSSDRAWVDGFGATCSRRSSADAPVFTTVSGGPCRRPRPRRNRSADQRRFHR